MDTWCWVSTEPLSFTQIIKNMMSWPIVIIATQLFCKTLLPAIIHDHTKFGYKRLSSSEDIFWTDTYRQSRSRIPLYSPAPKVCYGGYNETAITKENRSKKQKTNKCLIKYQLHLEIIYEQWKWKWKVQLCPYNATAGDPGVYTFTIYCAPLNKNHHIPCSLKSAWCDLWAAHPFWDGQGRSRDPSLGRIVATSPAELYP